MVWVVYRLPYVHNKICPTQNLVLQQAACCERTFPIGLRQGLEYEVAWLELVLRAVHVVLGVFECSAGPEAGPDAMNFGKVCHQVLMV